MGRKKYSGIKRFADKIVAKDGCSYKEAERRVKQMLSIFQEEIIDPEFGGVQFVDLFTLEKVHRASRRGRNPVTFEDITVPAHEALKVKLGEELYTLLNP